MILEILLGLYLGRSQLAHLAKLVGPKALKHGTQLVEKFRRRSRANRARIVIERVSRHIHGSWLVLRQRGWRSTDDGNVGRVRRTTRRRRSRSRGHSGSGGIRHCRWSDTGIFGSGILLPEGSVKISHLSGSLGLHCLQFRSVLVQQLLHLGLLCSLELLRRCGGQVLRLILRLERGKLCGLSLGHCVFGSAMFSRQLVLLS